MPFTVNRSLNVPNTGDLPGAWGTAAVNPNMSALDGMFGGVTTVSLTNSNVALTAGTGTVTPSAGPTQSDNAVIKFSGTLSGNCVITFPYPGFYIVRNNCVVGSFYVQARASGTGNVLGLPPGRAVHIWNDGTNMDFVNMPDVASYMDMAVSTSPAWMTACSVIPWLVCNGGLHTASLYTALFAMLGSTWGGNGVSTFGVPDAISRARLMLDINSSNRITVAGSGLDGAVLGTSGGSQLLQQHTHTVTDPGHVHPNSKPTATVPTTSGGTPASSVNIIDTSVGTTGITINNAGTGSSGNVPPSFIAGLTFIKT